MNDTREIHQAPLLDKIEKLQAQMDHDTRLIGDLMNWNHELIRALDRLVTRVEDCSSEVPISVKRYASEARAMLKSVKGE